MQGKGEVMRTYFKGEKGGSYPYPAEQANAEWFEDDAFLSGDYCGNGALARANVKAVQEDFAELEESAWWYSYGSHDSEWLRFHIGVESAKEGTKWGELRAVLDALEDYPCVDEDAWSNTECEEEEEAWSNFGARDFVSCLHKMAPHHETEFFQVIVDEVGLTLWHKLANAANVNGGSGVVHEQGGPCFYFDDFFGTRRHWQQKEWPWERVR